ncbi:amino acid ABC transporter substrate-binding protein [Cellvibrio zantedeschiae]|uniref:Amino acid ABC transporter substrate-binding protein n=1 Tax=Cellvibrio zantedeschiae TaxID=1237077 RepID=A0ABQ3AWQ3_9GAMM|nr:transporter substrate-binding domain-containing protein [Cellvibrio zantedeschiae]GGY69761.1 amino acid ABC transporter substrate-binding protein [Cellvibrio zantedeschiae]
MKLCLLLTMFTLALPSLSFGQTQLVLGAEDSWPPYSDKNGEGISTNIIKAAFAKVGITTKIQVRNYARVLQDVKAGLLDAGYNVTRQQNTEQEFIFGKEPILQAKAYWYFASKTKTKFKTPSALPDGFRVGCIIDYEYGDTYEHERQRFKEVKVPRQVQLIRMLQQGRIDAALMFEEEANQTLKDMGLQQDAIQKGMFNHTSDIYLAFSRKNPQSEENAKKLDQGIKILKETGEYQQLLNH